MRPQHHIRAAQTRSTDPRKAVQEFHAAVSQPDMALVVFFCSSSYDLDVLAAEMSRLFPGIQVVGCTTAGEIGPSGYQEASLSGASFSAATFSAVTGRIDNLHQFGLAVGQTFVQDLLRRLETQAPGAEEDSSFAYMLIDGLSVCEEPVARILQHALGKIPVTGGSAGDGLRFKNTFIYHDGRFHTDSAVVALVTTELPFRTFQTHHFVSGDERLVVTEADTANRVVKGINGLPAAEEYARLVGVEVAQLDPMRFASSPVVVLIDGTDYVRSIQKANPDGSLTFFCAIEEGLVFRVGHGEELVGNLTGALDRLRGEIGPLQLVLGCDCVLRNLEITQRGLKDRVGEVFRQNNVVGFSSYGEQFAGVHINQTFTGIAIGSLESDGAP